MVKCCLSERRSGDQIIGKLLWMWLRPGTGFFDSFLKLEKRRRGRQHGGASEEDL